MTCQTTPDGFCPTHGWDCADFQLSQQTEVAEVAEVAGPCPVDQDGFCMEHHWDCPNPAELPECNPEQIRAAAAALPCRWRMPQENHPDHPGCTGCLEQAKRALVAAGLVAPAGDYHEGLEEGIKVGRGQLQQLTEQLAEALYDDQTGTRGHFATSSYRDAWLKRIGDVVTGWASTAGA